MPIPTLRKTPLVCALLGLTFLLVTSCSGLRTRSPGGTVVTHTAAGAGAGALIGLAAGKPGTGAAIGAGVGLLAGVVEADRQSREERSYRRAAAPRPAPPVAQPRPSRASEAVARQRQAQEYLDSALKAENTHDSEYLLKRSLEVYPMAEAYNSLGLVYERQGKLSLAAEQWRRALSLEPTYGPARQNLDRLGR